MGGAGDWGGVGGRGVLRLQQSIKTSKIKVTSTVMITQDIEQNTVMITPDIEQRLRHSMR